MKNHKKYLALVTSTLLVSALTAGPAKADTPNTTPVQEPIETGQIQAVPASLHFEKPLVKTSPAVVAEVAPAPVVASKAVAQDSTPAPVAPVAPVAAAPAAVRPASVPVAAKAAPVAPAPAFGRGASIAAAAYAQIGVAQDCTALVSNSLAAVGINFHGWPAEYASLGTAVGSPQPGDILIYANAGAGVPHVAIYVGNGQAIHGGFNGSTVLFSANVGSGYTAIRVA